jgi:folate-binding protein YgfZ
VPSVTPPVPSAVHRPIRLGPEALTPETWTALESGTAVARVDVAVLAVSGPGAVACLQGLLTTDLEKPGDGAFIYGALLTAKGMIVVDGWAARRGTTVTYTTPVDVAERALAVFQHSLPPRLARVADITGDVAVFRLAGPRALATADAAGFAPPSVANESRAGGTGDDTWEVARPTEAAPFILQLTAPVHAAARVAARLASAGAVVADPLALEATRILAGWPRVGAETDDKTIPQEVRYDEIGGVSYTKGCYTGQETVSRVHFRGHPNRTLRGLRFDEAPDAERADVVRGDRDVGRVTSLLCAPGQGAGWLGLAVVRREVEPGAVVHAAGRDARVVDLPFHGPLGPTNTTARA